MANNQQASAQMMQWLERNAEQTVDAISKEQLIAILQSHLKSKVSFNVSVDEDFKEAFDQCAEFVKPFGITKGMLVEVLMRPGLELLGFPPGGK